MEFRVFKKIPISFFFFLKDCLLANENISDARISKQ